MGQKLAPSRRTRELLIAGAGYLLALGLGVLIGPAIAIALVVIASLFLVLVGASSEAVQRRFPAIGSLPLVEDQDFRVVAGADLDRWHEELLSAEADRIDAGEFEPEPLTFEKLKPQIEGLLDEARALWTELAERPPPARVGALYDMAVNWQGRVFSALAPYQTNLALDFKRGGSYSSPQLDSIAPTDGPTLQVVVERRGQVLRNFLDGTPGKDLEWGGDFPF